MCVCVCVCVCVCCTLSILLACPCLAELGHSFGSNHDPSGGGACDPPRGRGVGQGKYLMHMAAVDGSEHNNLVGWYQSGVTMLLLLPWKHRSAFLFCRCSHSAAACLLARSWRCGEEPASQVGAGLDRWGGAG